jgi:dephospho-CoA kinase
MYILGLTGGICSGKSTVAKILGELGATVIDADKLGHECYEPGTECYSQIVAQFGETILCDDSVKSINRRALGSIVFSDAERMSELTALVWPEIRRMLEQVNTWNLNCMYMYI